jgi:hypothetical protein
MRLVTHYKPDSEALAELLEVDVPWLVRWDRETAISDYTIIADSSSSR